MNPLRWLVKQLIGPDDDAPEPSPEELVTLASSVPESVAGLWQGTLKNEGIPCLPKSVGAPPYPYVLQRVDIQVRYQDLERARAILGLDDSPLPP